MQADAPYTGTDRRIEPRAGIIQAALDVVFGTLRWFRRHVRSVYVALGLYLFFGLLLAGLALGAFIGIADLIAGGIAQPIDEAVLRWLEQHRTPLLNEAALEVTALGATTVVWMTALVASAFLWLTGHRYSVVLLWVAMLGSEALNTGLKAGFARPRPEVVEWVAPYASFTSFPSGHAMTAMVAYGTLAYLVSRLEPTPRIRRFTLGITALVILLVGLSRVYLGVHYPSDILGGYLVGFAWATVCATGIEMLRMFRDRRPELEEAERDLEAGIRPVTDALRRHLRRGRSAD